MLFQSIRFRIVLWYMLILSVTLLVLGTVLYHNFSHKLKMDMDNLLRSRAQGIVESIDTYWESERLRTGKNLPANVFKKQDNINFIRIAQRWVNDKSADPALINSSVHIFDAYGHPVASSKILPVLTLSDKMLKDIYAGNSHFDDWKVELNLDRNIVLRTFTTPVIENGRLAYVVQVAIPLTDMREALHNLNLLLLLLFPLTVILTGIAGAFLARIALNPVHTMIEATHQITAANLRLRIDVPNSKDEIHFLAVTFNKMLARLEESFQSQRQLTEDISHELKTPLSVLKGELGVALKKARSAEEYESILLSSQEEVDSLIRIVENLLTLARLDNQTAGLKSEAIDLSQLARSVLDDMQILADQKNIGLKFDGGLGLTVYADRQQVCRLMLNLLDNAIKYTPRGGTVSVHLYQDDQMVKIEIADTGIGIPDEDMPHIFDRFYRVDKARGGNGFGLGLSIAQSIVQAHRGILEVKSILHKGSVFTASFPKL